MDDRYSPSAPSPPELPSTSTDPADLQADVHRAIENLEHIDQIESGLDATALAVFEMNADSGAPGSAGVTGNEAVSRTTGESTENEQVLLDAATQEAELEREIAELPDATAPQVSAMETRYDPVGDDSEDAEGEIDMDLGEDDEEEEEVVARSATDGGQVAVGAYDDQAIDPSLLEAPVAAAATQLSAAPIASTSVEPTPQPAIISALPTNPINPAQPAERKRDPRSASPTRVPPPRRRPGGQQRRSPSYSLDAKPLDPTPTPVPGAPTPSLAPAGPRAGLPVKPSAGGSQAQTGGRRGEPRSYAPRFSFEGVEWPEGIEGNSPSVMGHQALASSWAESKENVAANAQASLALFEAARADGDVDGARAWYQAFSKDNPTAIGPMLDMINFELAHGNFPQVVALYEKALRGLGGNVGAVPGVEIWRSYLHYIRRQNPIPAPGSANASTADAVRETIVRAYELALKEAGVDMASGPIWREYIGFLGEKECTNTWEAQTQTDAIRKVYHRAVAIPLVDVEQIWREYDGFENKLNKMTAKKFLAERSPLYMTARTVLRDLKAQTDPLVPMPIPPRPTRSEADRALVINWKKYLKWEESNPLDIEEGPVLQARVGYALRKCLTQMRFFPELWHQAAVFYQASEKPEEMMSYLRTGLEANRSSFLLTFALAEQEEIRQNKAAARSAYEDLIKIHGAEIDKLKTTIAKEVETAKGPEIEDDEVEFLRADDEDMEGAELSETQKRKAEREARGQAVIDRRQTELDDLVTAAGVIWIMQIRFARRTDGLRAARGVFSAARKSAYVSWHVYESSARMEYHCNTDANIATKIFELGLKAFPDDVSFAVKFLEFLIQINDDSNARALFERLVLKFPADKARPIWDAWSKHEYLYGDLAASQTLEARLKEIYQNDAPLRRFASRFVYNGIDEIASRDLGFGVKREAAPAPPMKRNRPEDSPMRSPRVPEPRFREERQPLPPHQPPVKRQRGFSPPRRNNRQSEDRRRDFSPPPSVRRDAPPSMPPPAVMPPALERDPSGLPRSVVWFMGNLPRARLFDGPIFKPEDLMDVLSRANIPGPQSIGGPPSMPMGGPGPQGYGGRGRY